MRVTNPYILSELARNLVGQALHDSSGETLQKCIHHRVTGGYFSKKIKQNCWRIFHA